MGEEKTKAAESLLVLAAALAEETPGEHGYPEEKEKINQLFRGRISEVGQGSEVDQSANEKFLRDKLYELRKWLSFLRHIYAAAKASCTVTIQLSCACIALDNIAVEKIQLPDRIHWRWKTKDIRKLLRQMSILTHSTKKSALKNELSLSRASYRSVRRRMLRIFLRSFARVLKRHAFQLGVGFLLTSYLLGMLLGTLKISRSTPINFLVGLLLALAAWMADKWVVSPWIDRVLASTRRNHLQANLDDLRFAFLWARVCRVFSSAVLHRLIDDSNEEYKNIGIKVSDPRCQMEGYFA